MLRLEYTIVFTRASMIIFNALVPDVQNGHTHNNNSEAIAAELLLCVVAILGHQTLKG